MAELLNKIGLGCATYWQASKAIVNQFSDKRIEEIQVIKLRRLIKYCYSNIKYYRELFDSIDFTPEEVKTVTDISKIPILTKEELRTRFWDFLPRQLPPCRVSRTSGSTGVPVCIFSDINSRKFNSAAVIRCRKSAGIPIIGKAIITPLKNASEIDRSPHWTFLQGIHKTYYVNPYIESEKNISGANMVLKSLKEPALIGITSAIEALAYKVQDKIFPFFKPCAVITGGEILKPQTKALIESVFQTKVTDVYACNEGGEIAWQCKESRYHINADNCIVEILKNGCPTKEEESGEIVITNLNRYSMPIIRYKIGDIARLSHSKCSCGCKLPILAEIIGRTGEDIYLPDGKIILWNQLKGFMNHPNVRQFQLVQNKDGTLTVKFVPEDDNNIEKTRNILSSRFEDLLGDSIKIDFCVVEKVDPAPSGKSKLVICHYTPPN